VLHVTSSGGGVCGLCGRIVAAAKGQMTWQDQRAPELENAGLSDPASWRYDMPRAHGRPSAGLRLGHLLCVSTDGSDTALFDEQLASAKPPQRGSGATWPEPVAPCPRSSISPGRRLRAPAGSVVGPERLSQSRSNHLLFPCLFPRAGRESGDFAKRPVCRGSLGGASRDRTGDLLLATQPWPVTDRHRRVRKPLQTSHFCR
jgi:hypothetical protein